MPLVAPAEIGDVKVTLRNGQTINSDVYEMLDDQTFNVDGVVMHLGRCIKVNGEVFPVNMITKVTAVRVRLEEVVVWDANAIQNPRMHIKQKVAPPPDASVERD